MMGPALLSVIIPVHNGASFLTEAIGNVLAQEYAPLEIIVVDDGSTDDTPRVAARFGHSIRYTYQPCRGPAAARNQGLDLARGDVIAFLDVDDLWPAGKLRRQVAYLSAHPEVAIVQGLIVQMEIDPTVPGPEPEFEECSEPYQFVNLGSAIYRREVFDRVGPFDEALRESEDMDWFFRAWELDISKVVQDQVALFYRRHSGNMTSEQGPAHLRILRVLKRHLDRYRAQGRAADGALPGRPTVAAYIGMPPAGKGRARVRDEAFTIISNDCWGSGLYSHAGLMYRTPFIGTRVLAPCYVELLKSPRAYLQSPLAFVDRSRYDVINDRRERLLGLYPIALLHGTVEVHFVHEPDEATARQKWERRRAKMNWDNLFVKFSQDPEACTDALLEEFDRLEYPYKVCFTYREYPELRSTIPMPDYFAPEAPMYFLSRQYFDTIGWLNRRHGPDTQAYRLPAGRAGAV